MTPLLILKDYEILYEGEHCVLYDMRNDVPHTAFISWRGFYRLDNPFFEKDMEIVLNFIREKCIRVLISDYSQSKIMTGEVIAWLQEHWYPSAHRYGLRNEAALAPESIFAKITLNNLFKSEKLSNIQVNLFAHFEEARQNAVNLAKKLWNLHEEASFAAFNMSSEEKLQNVYEIFATMEQNSRAVAETTSFNNLQEAIEDLDNQNFISNTDTPTEENTALQDTAQDELDSLNNIMEELNMAHQQLPLADKIATLPDTPAVSNEEIQAA
jgi:hypothetical protein